MAKILIVEDDRATAHMLAYFVNALGHEVQSASDGQSALTIVDRQPQDIIICDVMMAPMDGITFTAQLRAENVTTPIVLCSSNTSAEMVNRARAAGANEFLNKPLKLEQVRRSIDSALAVEFEPPTTEPEIVPTSPPLPTGVTGRLKRILSTGVRGRLQRMLPKPNRTLSAELELLLPGAFYAEIRQQLIKLTNRPWVLVDAEVGLLETDLLKALHENGPSQAGPLAIHHLRNEPLEEVVNGLLNEQGELGEWFEQSKAGTLVLLEIERLPLVLQARLNSALRQSGGGRLIVSTATDPDKLHANGQLDTGLYFRFATCLLRIPPVRECEEQLLDLFTAAVQGAPGYIFGSLELKFEAPAAMALRAYTWPENVAELRNVAAWTTGRLRSTLVTMAQLPERFFKARIPTLQEALVSAQVAHIKRALRVYAVMPIEAAKALGVPVQQVEAIMAGSLAPLFRIDALEAEPIKSAPEHAKQLAAPESAFFYVLLLVQDPVLRAAAARIPVRGLQIAMAADGLEALALLAAKPTNYGCALVAGGDELFSIEELVTQLHRIAPKLRLAVLAEDIEDRLQLDYRAAPPRNVTDIEDAITHLLLMA
jgi:DNA-binding NtrC family response regulator